MAKTFCVKLPDKLYTALRGEATRRGITKSEVARDMMRQHLGAANKGWESGYAEGKLAGYREAQQRIGQALADD